MTAQPASFEEPDARSRAAAALRRLGHAMVANETDAALLERIAAQANATADLVERAPRRSRQVDLVKRAMWDHPPRDGEPMSHFAECLVSGEANPLGIAMTVVREGDHAVASFTLGAAFEGAPERAHGGVVAAILDDIMGYVLVLHRTPAFTGRLTISYRAPVPLRAPLRARAHLESREGRKLVLRATMASEGEVLAEADAVFIAIPPNRFINPERG